MRVDDDYLYLLPMENGIEENIIDVCVICNEVFSSCDTSSIPICALCCRMADLNETKTKIENIIAKFLFLPSGYLDV